MVVHTRTPRLQRLRRGGDGLYASDHPLDSLTSSANGDSEFQTQAGSSACARCAMAATAPIISTPPIDASNPYFTFDPAACIVCSRCVRACEEVQGTFALTILGRGFDLKVGAAGVDFLSSECVSCGACVQACPTSALNEKSVIEMGAPERTVVTTCAYCGVGCAFKAELKGDEVVRMIPYKAGKANEGHSCVKGRFAYGYATHKDRILKPMIRGQIEDPWREVSWARRSPMRRASSSASSPSTAATRPGRSAPRAAPTRKCSWSRSWCAPGSATTTSTLAPASATRRPASACPRPSAPRPAPRISSQSRRRTSWS